jgi:ABC-type multidrug transport system permease subunit
MTWCRHMDSQRGVTNSALFAISSAVVGLITLDGKVNQSDQALGWFVVAIGIFGIAFSLKLYERFHTHHRRAKGYLQALSDAVPNARLIEIKNAATHPWSKHRVMVLGKMVVFGGLLYLFIVVIGFVLLHMASQP